MKPAMRALMADFIFVQDLEEMMETRAGNEWAIELNNCWELVGDTPVLISGGEVGVMVTYYEG